MMPACFLALIALTSSTGDAPKTADALKAGESWIEKTESHLYAWPKPGSLVRFQVRTNMLDASIAAMEKDPEVATDADKGRWIDALKHVAINGTLDTETGNVTTSVDLRYEPTNPKGKVASEKLKSGVGTMISNAFQGLPLHDPSLLRKGGSVLGSEENGDSILVTVTGKDKGEQNRIHLNRRSELPEFFEMKDLSMHVRYAEVVPGRFAPSRLDVKSGAGKESHAEYTYQKAGEIAFPSTIRVFQGPQTVTFSFVSLKVEPRSP